MQTNAYKIIQTWWIFIAISTHTARAALPDPCDSNPCHNNGICSPYLHIEYLTFPEYKEIRENRFICICPDFKGTLCQYNDDNLALPDPCVSNPCLNNGTCDWNVITLQNADHFYYQCTCPPNIKGNRCQLTEDPCKQGNKCQNGAVCVWTEGVSVIEPDTQFSSFQCNACPSGIRGAHCDIIQDPCQNITCENNGTCVWLTTNGKAECKCKEGYMGLHCQLKIENVCDLRHTAGFTQFGLKLTGTSGIIQAPTFPISYMYKQPTQWQKNGLSIYSNNQGCGYYLILNDTEQDLLDRKHLIKISFSQPVTYFIGCGIREDMYVLGIDVNFHLYFSQAVLPMDCNINVTSSCIFITAKAFHILSLILNPHTRRWDTKPISFRYEIISRESSGEQDCQVTSTTQPKTTIKPTSVTTMQTTSSYVTKSPVTTLSRGQSTEMTSIKQPDKLTTNVNQASSLQGFNPKIYVCMLLMSLFYSS